LVFAQTCKKNLLLDSSSDEAVENSMEKVPYPRGDGCFRLGNVIRISTGIGSSLEATRLSAINVLSKEHGTEDRPSLFLYIEIYPRETYRVQCLLVLLMSRKLCVCVHTCMHICISVQLLVGHICVGYSQRRKKKQFFYNSNAKKQDTVIAQLLNHIGFAFQYKYD
jgi:hypothetical protein